MTNGLTLTFKTPPPVRGRVHIAEDAIVIDSEKYPNAWRRFWYWALLGWRWEDLRGAELEN